MHALPKKCAIFNESFLAGAAVVKRPYWYIVVSAPGRLLEPSHLLGNLGSRVKLGNAFALSADWVRWEKAQRLIEVLEFV